MEKLKLNLLKPLKVKCTDTDCKKDLHCFKATAEMKKRDEVGVCRECGVNLVDWQRLHSRDLQDVEYTFDALKHELIRHHFWHIDIDQRALNYAKRKGRTALRAAVRSRIKASIAQPNNPYDGRQTPMEGSGNPIHYAQHATASCCRKCVEYWHNIPVSVILSTEEIEYLTNLAMMFLVERLPDLQDGGEMEGAGFASAAEKKNVIGLLSKQFAIGGMGQRKRSIRLSLQLLPFPLQRMFSTKLGRCLSTIQGN